MKFKFVFSAFRIFNYLPVGFPGGLNQMIIICENFSRKIYPNHYLFEKFF